MTTHGRAGLRRAILGSVAGRVREHAAVPSILTRPPAVGEHQALHGSRGDRLAEHGEIAAGTHV